jgi:hypothetical protein
VYFVSQAAFGPFVPLNLRDGSDAFLNQVWKLKNKFAIVERIIRWRREFFFVEFLIHSPVAAWPRRVRSHF